MQTSPSTEQPATELLKKFGTWTGIFTVFGSMVGNGIITTTGMVVKDTGSHIVNLILWALGGILAMCGVLTMAEMATAMPKAGGDYIYVREAFGRSWAFVYGWAMVVIGFAAPIALVSNSTANYLFVPIQSALGEAGHPEILGMRLDAVNTNASGMLKTIITMREKGISPAAIAKRLSEIEPDHPVTELEVRQVLATVDPPSITNAQFNALIGSLLIALFAISHCLGHVGSSLTQGVFSILDIAILLAMAAVLLFADKGNLTNFSVSTNAAAQTLKFTTLGSSLVLVMYAYTGWNGAVYLAGELRDPPRMLPRSLICGCIAVTVLYLLINIAYGYALSVSDIQQLSQDGRDRIAASALMAMTNKRVVDWFSFAIGVGRVAAISVFILTGARVIYAMALDKLMFPKLALLHPSKKVPVLATLFLAFLSILFLWSGTFEDIANFTGYGLGMMCLLVVTPIFALRRRPDYRPTFRTPLYPFPTILFMIVNIIMLIAAALDNPVVALLNIAIFVAAFVWLHA